MICLCTLDRFGYTLTLYEESEPKARESMIKAYKKIYKQWNGGSNPTADELKWAINDISIVHLEKGKVEWL